MYSNFVPQTSPNLWERVMARPRVLISVARDLINKVIHKFCKLCMASPKENFCVRLKHINPAKSAPRYKYQSSQTPDSQ